MIVTGTIPEMGLGSDPINGNAEMTSFAIMAGFGVRLCPRHNQKGTRALPLSNPSRIYLFSCPPLLGRCADTVADTDTGHG